MGINDKTNADSVADAETTHGNVLSEIANFAQDEYYGSVAAELKKHADDAGIMNVAIMGKDGAGIGRLVDTFIRLYCNTGENIGTGQRERKKKGYVRIDLSEFCGGSGSAWNGCDEKEILKRVFRQLKRSTTGRPSVSGVDVSAKAEAGGFGVEVALKNIHWEIEGRARKYIDKIRRLLSRVGIETVVFERFNGKRGESILEMLCRLNEAVNADHGKQDMVTFLYAVEGEVGVGNGWETVAGNHAFFFDYSLNSISAKGMLRGFNRKLGEACSRFSLSDDFILDVCDGKHVTDACVLMKAFSYYADMYFDAFPDGGANSPKENDRLFALCLYRCMYEDDYGLLKRNQGVIPDIIERISKSGKITHKNCFGDETGDVTVPYFVKNSLDKLEGVIRSAVEQAAKSLGASSMSGYDADSHVGFLRFLFSRGYLDEDYEIYMTGNVTGLTKNECVILHRIKSRHCVDFYSDVTHPEAFLGELASEDFRHKYTMIRPVLLNIETVRRMDDESRGSSTRYGNLKEFFEDRVDPLRTWVIGSLVCSFIVAPLEADLKDFLEECEPFLDFAFSCRPEIFAGVYREINESHESDVRMKKVLVAEMVRFWHNIWHNKRIETETEGIVAATAGNPGTCGTPQEKTCPSTARGEDESLEWDAHDMYIRSAFRDLRDYLASEGNLGEICDEHTDLFELVDDNAQVDEFMDMFNACNG